MKIILVNNLYGQYARGGAEMITKIMYELLMSHGHEVRIITAKPKFKPISKLENNVYYLSSLYYCLSKFPVSLRLVWHCIEFISFIKFIQFLKILKHESPDLAITHNMKGLGLMSVLAIKFLRIKHIHYLHDIQLLHPSGLMMAGEEKKIGAASARIFQSINRLYFNKADAVIAPSQWLMNLHASRNFFTRAAKNVIFNPINAESLAIKVDEKTSGGGKAKFLYVGQVEKHKGVFELIQAFSGLPDDPPWSLDIAGSGSQIDLAGKAMPNIDRKNIGMRGRLDNESVLRLMAESDCLIVPSICYENSPAVIYEAARTALPVLASCFGGIKELAEYFGYMIFDPLDAEDFKTKIIQALKNREALKKMGQIPHEKLQRISLECYYKNLKNIFDSLKI